MTQEHEHTPRHAPHEMPPVKATARLSHPVIHASHETELFLRIDVSARARGPEGPPLDLAVVLDRSGSMYGEKIAFAKDAVQRLVDGLTVRDHMAVVAYDDTVDVIVPRRRVDDALVIRSRVKLIEPRGCTNLSAGLLAGLQQLGESGRGLRRVLLLSDGLANAGLTDQRGLADIAAGAQAAGAGVSTFGVGLDFDEELLQAVADGGGGNYYYIDAPEDAPGIFAQELGELGTVVAQNLTVDFEPAKARLLAVLGFDEAGLPVVRPPK